jgi:type VI secretion system protein ImpK
MKDEIANLVHPVLSYALQLRERLEHESLDLDHEQAVLKGLLLTDHEARRLADYGGEAAPNASVLGGQAAGDSVRRAVDHFLGIRYAVVCWLDEIFIDSRWVSDWNERKLEVSLYGTNDRAWKFWEQAKRAESRAGTDALEVFFLCAVLGFRGDLREQPDRLKSWASAVQARITRQLGQEWPAPAELDPPTFVPPRRGRDALRRMLLAGAAACLVLIPLLAVVVVQKLFG